MKKRFAGLTFILITSILPYSGLNSQSQIGKSLNTEVSDISDRYSMRLDFMTESQVDEIIQLRKIGLDDLCDKTMGCKSRTDVVLGKGDKIQLFDDNRISSVELIKIEAGKKTSIASSVSNKKGSYIIVPQEITRENIENYMIQIL